MLGLALRFTTLTRRGLWRALDGAALSALVFAAALGPIAAGAAEEGL